MHLGTILITLGLSLLLATYISRPFQSENDDFDQTIADQTAEIPDAVDEQG
jgi:hypothetical protein